MPLHPPSQARSGTGQLSVSHSPALVESGVADAVITSRWGGVSEGAYESLNLGLHVDDDADAVIANRTRAAAAIGLDLGQLVFCRQSHGAEVAVVGVGDRGRGTRSEDDALAGTDALVTSDPDVGLVVMVADCVPVVLLDPEARVLACVHAGWRGTVARVCRATVATMGSLGAEPARMLAWLGPAIAPERYEVGDDVADAARAAFPDSASWFGTVSRVGGASISGRQTSTTCAVPGSSRGESPRLASTPPPAPTSAIERSDHVDASPPSRGCVDDRDRTLRLRSHHG